MFVYLDIETLPGDSAALFDEIASTVSPPKTLKKTETIAAWERDEKPGVIDERIRQTALDGTYGRVLGIACAFAEGAPEVWIDDEREALLALFSAVLEASKTYVAGGEVLRDLIFVGHNIISFDLRFIWQRAVIHNIRPPLAFTDAVRAGRYGRGVHDTMLMWNPERERRISLDKLCKALGVRSPKGTLDGSQIFDAWKAGRIEEIRAYMRDDVIAVRECHRAMIFGAPVRPDAELERIARAAVYP